jgi:hypothetical protein
MLVNELDLGDAFGDMLSALPMARPVMHTKTKEQTAVVTTLAEPSKAIAPMNPADPARIGYPATLPIELALRIGTTKSVCEAYNISEAEWELIRHHPVFLDDLARAAELVKEAGMTFKLKAKLQAEEMLKTSWRMVHDPDTPPAVRADLLKATVRWAEYDNPKVDPNAVAGAGAGFAIQINFNKPQG